MAFLHGDIKLYSTLNEMGFLRCVQEKAVYRKVPNGEFIVVAINVDDLFATEISLDHIYEFKRRMASQFEMSDLGELTYYLGTQVVKVEDEPEVEATEFMAATAASCQVFWLREVLAGVTGNKQVIVEHVSGENQRAYSLMNALARIRFKEMRSLLGVQELPHSTQKFRG
ncbi:uncharacterized mitochondrial protein-like protein [Tanacetum coccineum]